MCQLIVGYARIGVDMDVVNITPHTVKIGEMVLQQETSIPPVRIATREQLLYTINEIPVKMIMHGHPDLALLPPVRDNTIYVVSRLVADVYRDNRDDLVFPYSFTRTNSGRILGCRALARFEPR